MQIFEPRYLRMVSRCMQQENGFVSILIRDGKETGTPATHYPIGVYCEIIDFNQQDNGLLGITAQGQYRTKIISSKAQDDGLLLAHIKKLPDLLPSDRQNETDLELIDLVKHIQELLGQPYSKLRPEKHSSVWLISRLLEWTGLDNKQKYDLLCLDDGQELVRLALARLNINLKP